MERLIDGKVASSAKAVMLSIVVRMILGSEEEVKFVRDGIHVGVLCVEAR